MKQGSTRRLQVFVVVATCQFRDQNCMNVSPKWDLRKEGQLDLLSCSLPSVIRGGVDFYIFDLKYCVVSIFTVQ